MDLYNILISKMPFIYDDGEIIIAVSGDKCKSLNNSVNASRFEKYYSTLKQDINYSEKKKAIDMISTLADGEVGMCKNCHGLQEYLSRANEDKKKALTEQVIFDDQKKIIKYMQTTCFASIKMIQDNVFGSKAELDYVNYLLNDLLKIGFVKESRRELTSLGISYYDDYLKGKEK